MPNWVFNYLAVEGNSLDLEKFKEELATEDKVFSFTKIIPLPVVKEWYEYNWLGWNIENFGVKWDCSESELLDFVDGLLVYKFDTPWSPVKELMSKLSEKYPHLEFKYEYEEEEGWGGEYIFKQGNILYSKEWDIPSSHADFANHPNRECYCLHDQSDRFDDCPIEVGA